MKLGICYMVFDGEELLEFAIKPIRKILDHISVTYQTTSYFNNKYNPLPILENLKEQNLIDELIYYEPNLKLQPKENELILRNIGLEISKKANCTHHISADTDEFYTTEQLEYAKNNAINYDFTMVPILTYYKQPTFQIISKNTQYISFIHPVNNNYEFNKSFPFNIDITRRLKISNNYKIFNKNEITMHHMSYIRKDMRKKIENSTNGKLYKINKFLENFNNYKPGQKVKLAPYFINEKTIITKNMFNINI